MKSIKYISILNENLSFDLYSSYIKRIQIRGWTFIIIFWNSASLYNINVSNWAGKLSLFWIAYDVFKCLQKRSKEILFLNMILNPTDILNLFIRSIKWTFLIDFNILLCTSWSVVYSDRVVLESISTVL